MLNNFTKSSIRLGPACDSECNSIKSHKTDAVEAILKKWKFAKRKIPQVLRKESKGITLFSETIFKYFQWTFIYE